MKTMKTLFTTFALAAATLVFVPAELSAQHWLHDDGESETNQSMFRDLDSEWPAPTEMRAASGFPGAAYWQQRADYVIETVLDTVNHVVSGSERITYHNNSPDVLRFVWVQLDQNVRSLEHSRSYETQGALPAEISERARQFLGARNFDGGYELAAVRVGRTGGTLADAEYRVNDTMMRIELPRPLASGETVDFEIEWSFRVPDFGRGAKEEVSDGWIYEIAQWFPRMAVYDDVSGWQTDQFLGRGEFYLEFGDYDVSITVPANHIVEATGMLQNPEEVLTPEQRQRLARAADSDTPVYIIAPDEVMTPESRPRQDGTLTWRYLAEDVRDFAWASSKTFVWDAAGFHYPDDDRLIEAHSFYPRDAMPLWNDISTAAILQTLRTYGEMAFEYPYPKASNVNGPVGGMEYPMVAFCGARPRGGELQGAEAAQGYSNAVKWALMAVTIHEIGHNWFPMIVASDERKWTWMDEGLNTFLQHYAEVELDPDFPRWRGSPPEIRDYMRDPDQVPIMTHSDLIHKDFGNNGYSKPAAGLTLLREVVLGPEAFDQAFSGYAQAWSFKKPQPSDFFRAMDEGAGENLAWMWRGWFYTTHANDQALTSVERQATEELLGPEAAEDRGRWYYRLTIENEGGLVMPIRMDLTFDDGSTTFLQLPVDVWRNNEKRFTYGLFTDNALQRVEIDPGGWTADIDATDNVWTEAPTT